MNDIYNVLSDLHIENKEVIKREQFHNVAMKILGYEEGKTNKVTEDKVAYVDKEICTSCGACIKKCPKMCIERIPASAPVYVACNSKCRGKEVMAQCQNGCIGCGLCAKNCTQKAITMVDNLPVIDYNLCTGCKTCVSKCPRKCIKEF